MDIIKAIHERKSVRKYRIDTIPKEILGEILEAARLAPSWANTQVWRFIIVSDQAIKEQLQDTLSPNNPARKAMVDAPVVFCIAAQRGLSGYKQGSPATDKGDWFMFDCGIAMEHIALAAWNFGLGTVHVGLFDAKRVEEVLQIPDGYSIVEMMPMGYFDEIPKERPRKSLEEIAFQDTFGRPRDHRIL